MLQNKSASFVRSGLIGIAIGMVFLLLGGLAVAAMINAEKIAMENLPYAVMILTFLAVWVGCFLARPKEKKLQGTLITGMGIYLVLIGIGMLCFDGKMEGVLVTMILALGATFSTLLVGMNSRKGHKYRRHRV